MAGPIKIPVELAMKMGGATGGAAAGGAGGAVRGAAGMAAGVPGQAAAGMASIAKQHYLYERWPYSGGYGCSYRHIRLY